MRLDIIDGFSQTPVKHVLAVEPTENEATTALRWMANAKAVGLDELPVKITQTRAESLLDRAQRSSTG